MTLTDIARGFMSGRERFVTWRGDTYVYRDGHYRRVEAGSLTREIYDFLDEIPHSLDAMKVEQIARSVRDLTFVPGERQPPFRIDGDEERRQLLSVRNGILDLTDIARQDAPPLLPTSREYFSTGCVSYPYDPGATCPEFEEFVRWLACGDGGVAGLLQDFAGGFLLEAPYAKALWLHGQGANGKTAFISVISGVLGEENVTSLGLDQLTQRFALANAVHRLMIYVPDADVDTDLPEGRLKSLISQDKVRVEDKYKPGLVVRPRAKILIASNHAPRFRDRTDGIWRRLIVVPCRARIDEKEARLDLAEGLIRREGSGILNWILAGAARLNARGHFDVPEVCRHELEDVRAIQNSAVQFIRERLVASESSSVTRDDLLSAYQQWARVMTAKPFGYAKFLEELRREFGDAVKTARPGKRGADRPHVIRGIDWREVEHEAPRGFRPWASR